MKTVLDTFEQTIEDNAELFTPLSDAEKNEVETIIDVANKQTPDQIQIQEFSTTNHTNIHENESTNYDACS